MNASPKKRTWLWILILLAALAMLAMLVVVGIGVAAFLLWGMCSESPHPPAPPMPTASYAERPWAEAPEQATVAPGQPWNEFDEQRRALQAALEQAQIERAGILRHADEERAEILRRAEEERADLLANNQALTEQCRHLERQLVETGNLAKAEAQARVLAVTVAPEGQYIHGTVAYNADGLRDLLRASAAADPARTVAFTVDPRVGAAQLADLVALCRQCGVVSVRFNLTPTELLKE